MKKFLLAVAAFAITGLVQIQAQDKKVSEAEANNPLAKFSALNLHSYYTPGTDDSKGSMTSMIRYAQPFAEGKFLVRATLPFTNINSGGRHTTSLEGLNIFATYTISKPSSKTMVGIGPMVSIPTAFQNTTDYAGNELISGYREQNWSVGGALVLFNIASPVLQKGALITYEHSVGSVSEQAKNELVIQPILMAQLGKGTYLRSVGMTKLNFERQEYTIPFGLGIGQVVKVGSTMFNFIFEPQYDIYSNTPGKPAFTLFTGINMQFL